MNINLQPNITGTNVKLVRGATQADLTNAVNNAKTHRDESQAFSIVSETKSVESAYSASNALIYRNQSETFATSINPSNIVHISGTETITGNKTFSGTVSGLTSTTVGLGNVTNESKYTMFTNPTFTGTATLPFTTSIGNVSSTELGYIDGVTSSIQTQLDSKVAKVTSTDNAVVRFNGLTGEVQNSDLIINDNGQIVSNLKTIGGVGYNVDTSTFIANTLASGAVIERGNNANGEYVKFADGTMICTYRATVTDQAIATSYSGILFTGFKTHTFPHIFNSIPSVAPFGRWATSASWSTVRMVDVTMVDVYYIDVATRAAGSSFLVGYTAIGRWK